MQAVSRIAPTPSGYLHIGNAANFLLTWLAVRLRGGRLLLRIDDLDRDRCREAFVDDIFASLEWLGIEPDEGPSDSADFFAHYSQTLRYGEYREAMERMEQGGAALFACECSRRQLEGASRYPGVCRDKGLTLLPGRTAMRIAVPAPAMVTVGGETLRLDEALGDFILWRRDGIPAYQLVSLVEDVRSGVNLIIRGRDLFDSSAAQLFLAHYLGAERFLQARFIHHELIRRADGGKFSKSDNDLALRNMRRDLGERQACAHVYAQILHLLGLPPHAADRPASLLDYCLESARTPASGNALFAQIMGAA